MPKDPALFTRFLENAFKKTLKTDVFQKSSEESGILWNNQYNFGSVDSIFWHHIAQFARRREEMQEE